MLKFNVNEFGLCDFISKYVDLQNDLHVESNLAMPIEFALALVYQHSTKFSKFNNPLPIIIFQNKQSEQFKMNYWLNSEGNAFSG